MYLDRYQNGDRVWLFVVCVNGSNDQGLPGYVPRARLYRNGTYHSSIELAAQDRYNSAGLFGREVLLDDDYATGNYLVTIPYVVGGIQKVASLAFELVSGGDSSGAIIGLASFPRPEADYLVAMRNNGDIIQGRNPRLTRAEGTF